MAPAIAVCVLQCINIIKGYKLSCFDDMLD